MKSVISISVFLLLIIHASFGQSLLKGVVRDTENQPIASANVYFPELNKGTISANDGTFSFSALPAGRFIIQASHLAFGTYTAQISLQNGGNSISITMHPSIIETSETVISGGTFANQHESALKIDIIRPGEAGASSTATASELLTQLPGVDMISKGQGVSKPSIRGLAMNNILILENGFRVENYQYSDHHPLGIDEHGVGTIEVIKGPASLIYGSDAMGGVINFLGEMPAPVGKIQGEYEAKLFSSSLGQDQSISLHGAKEKWHAGIRASQRSHADYLQGDGNFVPNTRFNEKNLKANLGLSSRRSVHRVFFSIGDLSYGISEHEVEDLISERGRKVEYFYQDFSNWSLANSNRFFWGKTKFELNASARRGSLLHAEEAEEVEIEMRLLTYSLESKLNIPLGKKAMLLAGLQTFRQNNLNLNLREVILLPNATMTDISGFMLIEYSPAERLHLQAGLRADQRQINSESVGDSLSPFYRQALSPKYQSPSLAVGGTYHLTSHWLIRANLASSHRNPTLAELSSRGLHELRFEVGDASLKTQRGLQVDLGSHLHKQNITMDIALFHSIIDDYIFISPDGDTTNEGYSIYRYIQKDARIRGAEFALHYHPESLSWLHIAADLSMLEGILVNEEHLPYIPALKTNLEFMVRGKGNKYLSSPWVSVRIHRAASQTNPAPEEESTESYTLVHFHAGTELPFISKGCSVRVGVNNLLDINYVDHLSLLKESGFYNPGRNISISLNIPFYLK
jgi:iron complex outermembrane recepter protein